MSAPEFNPLDDIGTIRVADIEIGERLRKIDPVWADAIGRAMLREGQATPIVVCKLPGKTRWTLVAGAHRVEGARRHGIEHLRAEVIGVRESDRAQREISENLWRRGLDPLERAEFIAKQVEIIKVNKGIDPTQSGRSVSAQVRWERAKGGEAKAEANMQGKILSLAYGWSEDVAEALGVSVKTITRGVSLYRHLAPSIVEQLRAVRHPALGSAAELHKLARLKQPEQGAVVDRLVTGDVKKVSEALACCRSGSRAPIDAESKRLSTIFGTLHRMSPSERLGLFQSPAFHDLIPAEARRLLAPMRRMAASAGAVPHPEGEKA